MSYAECQWSPTLGADVASLLDLDQPTNKIPKITTQAMATGKPNRRFSDVAPLAPAFAARATLSAEFPLAMREPRYPKNGEDVIFFRDT